MSEEDLLVDVTARVLMLPTPADQIKLPPPPPARVDESAAMWRSRDAVGDVEQVALTNEGDREAAAAYALWLGGMTLHAAIADSRKEREDEDEDDDLPKLDDDPREPRS